MTRYIRWQILLILFGVVLVALLLTYLAVNYTTVLRPGHGGTYVEGVVGFPSHLTPLLSFYDEVDQDICSLVFSGLTRLDEDGEVEADLARDWEVTPDGLSYTFHLRSNAYWHDGTPVTADDVIFTVKLLQDPDFSGPPELGADVWRTVKVEKVDRRTVRFALREPYAPFLHHTTVGILPSHILAGTHAAELPAAQFNLHPVGSGPFQVEEVEIEDGRITSVVLRYFPRYYRARPYLDRIQFRFYPSYGAVLDAYEAGKVEGIARVRSGDLAHASGFTSLNLFSSQIAEYGVVFLNLARSDLPFFQDREVRQALMYALDRRRIIDEALAGQALVADSPIIPGTWAYSANVPSYGYEPDRSGKLLDEAGWEISEGGGGMRNKDGQRLAFTLLTSNKPRRARVARALAEQWAAVGIEVTVRSVPALEVRDALREREFEAVLAHLRWAGDPDPYPFWHETQVDEGQNYAGFAHRIISELIERARVTVNQKRRKELYDEFQRVFAEEVPALLLYVPVYTYGVDERIRDVRMGPLMYPSDRFRTISDWWIVHRRILVSEGGTE